MSRKEYIHMNVASCYLHLVLAVNLCVGCFSTNYSRRGGSTYN